MYCEIPVPRRLGYRRYRVHRFDARYAVRTTLVLDQQIAPIVPKTDTEFVKHVRIRSELLSRFWGRDVFIGAHVLVPKGFDSHPQVRYPLMVFHGHYPDDISEFRTTPPDPDLKPDYSERFHLHRPCELALPRVSAQRYSADTPANSVRLCARVRAMNSRM